MEILIAKEQSEFNDWDNFVANNPKGNHLILTDWLDSFKSYGFDKEIIFIKENNQIIGGFGAVIAKFSIFKFYILPYGPLVNEKHQNQIPQLVENAKKRAISNSCCYFQISIPKSNSEELIDYSYPLDITLDNEFKPGKLFKYVYAADGVNFCNLKNFSFNNSDELLMSLSSNTRRHIKKATNNIDDIKSARTNEEIKSAYELCLLNAQNSNYSLRAWKDIKNSLINTIKKDKGLFLTVIKDETVIGSGFFIDSGKHLTYLFGGTIKTTHDISTGYAIHWEAIKISLSLGYKWYNISLGGSKGVKNFKSKFNTKEIYYENAHYHIVLNSFKFKLFMFAEKRIKPYKSTIAKWLSFIK